jgi:hypothetical protein
MVEAALISVWVGELVCVVWWLEGSGGRVLGRCTAHAGGYLAYLAVCGAVDGGEAWGEAWYADVLGQEVEVGDVVPYGGFLGELG